MLARLIEYFAFMLIAAVWVSCKTATDGTSLVSNSESRLPSAFALTPQSQWSRQIAVGKDQEFILRKILPQIGGGALVFGSLNNNVSFKQELIVHSLQASGSTQWSRSLPSIPSSVSVNPVDAVTVADGGIFTLNNINYGGNGDQTDSIVSRLNAQGTVIWQQKFAGEAQLDNYGLALKPDSLGGVIEVGNDTVSVSDSGIKSQCYIRHHDGKGQLLWQSFIKGLESCSLSSFDPAILFDKEGNLYLALENAVVKLDPQGQEVWRVLGRAFAIGFYNETLFVTSPQKTWALNKNGKILWELNDQGGLYLHASAAGIYATSTEFAESGSGSRLRLMRFSFDGKPLWSKLYTGGEKSFAHGIAVNTKGELQVFGEIWTKMGLLRVPQPEAAMLSFDSQGKDLWQAVVKNSINGSSFFMEGDTGFYMADLTGLVTRFILSKNPLPAVKCPWYNPRCKS